MATVKNSPAKAEATALEAWAPDRTLVEVERWLTEPGYVIPWPDQDPAAASADIARQILGSDDPLAPQAEDALAIDQAVGVRFTLLAVEFRPSDKDSGADEGGAYAILRGATDQGEALTIITGSNKVLARALAAVKHGKLGTVVQVVNAGKSRQGFTFYDLVGDPDAFPEA